MHINDSISPKAGRRTLFLLLVLLLSVHLLGIHAQAFTCSSVAFCRHCAMDSHRHSSATKPHVPRHGCPLDTQSVPCDLESAGTFARSQFILSSGGSSSPNLPDVISELPDGIAGKSISNRTRPLRHFESTDHNVPIYLQNLTLLC